MQRTIIALAAAALVAAALPSPVEARCRGCGVGAGIIGGLAAGAIIGSAIANGQPRYDDPAAAYDAVPPANYDPADSPDYIDGASCHMERQQVWIDGRYRMRRVQICE
jgi:hypothetical protein